MYEYKFRYLNDTIKKEINKLNPHLRLKAKSGIARSFCVHINKNNEIYLLLSYTKKTSKIPQKTMNTLLERRKLLNEILKEGKKNDKNKR